MTKALQTFNIVRQIGEPNKVMTIWGWEAYRQKELFAPEPYNTLIPCLHYDNHFIYEISDKPEHKNIPAFLCTCGSVAVVIGPGAYIHDASMSNFRQVEVEVLPNNTRMVKITRGYVFACMFRNCIVDQETHEIYGKHADGST